MWFVQIALRRPYTFIVLAIVIALFGLDRRLRPDRYFSRHQDSGHRRCLDLRRPAARRYVGPHHLLLRTAAHLEVNDIEHVESQSLPGRRGEDFFQGVGHFRSARAGHLASQTVLKSCRRASRRPNPELQRLHRSDPAAGPRQPQLAGAESSTSARTSFGPRARLSPGRVPSALWRQDSADSDRSRSERCRPKCSPPRCGKRASAQNQIIPAGTPRSASSNTTSS